MRIVTALDTSLSTFPWFRESNISSGKKEKIIPLLINIVTTVVALVVGSVEKTCSIDGFR